MPLGTNAKTEKPTGKRLGEARSKGQVAKSMDINSAAALLCGFLLLYFAGSRMQQQLGVLMKEYLRGKTNEPLTTTMFSSLAISLTGNITNMLLPLIGGLMFVGVAASIGQAGFLISFQKLKPNLGIFNPINGLKNMFFSLKSFVRFAMSLAKLAIVAAVAYFSIKKDFAKFLPLSSANLQQIFSFAAYSVFWLGIKIAIVLLFLAILDYAYQKWQYIKDLMMTKQEVKDEAKQAEGDPMVKGKIRSIQRQWAIRRMMSNVPQADVVVTNPTHLAIALKYDSNTMEAPKVLAKGADLIAKRIVKIAKEHDIPIYEDKPLAHALFKTVEIGYEIPQKLYHAVARVLSYIYKLRRTHGR